jgi:hypothetical protein
MATAPPLPMLPPPVDVVEVIAVAVVTGGVVGVGAGNPGLNGLVVVPCAGAEEGSARAKQASSASAALETFSRAATTT